MFSDLQNIFDLALVAALVNRRGLAEQHQLAEPSAAAAPPFALGVCVVGLSLIHI